MHVLQHKHTKLKSEEVESILKEYNISVAQLPKIRGTDPSLPKDSKFGDIIKIDRDKKISYFRVVV